MPDQEEKCPRAKTKKETFKKLDALLSHLSKSIEHDFSYYNFVQYKGTNGISGLEMDEMMHLLIEEGYVYKRKLQDPAKSSSDTIYRLTFEGRFFLEKGGFTYKYNIQKLKKIWIIVKTIAATLNAIIILLIAFWSVKVSISANDDKQRVKQLEQQIIDIKKSKRDTVYLKDTAP